MIIEKYQAKKEEAEEKQNRFEGLDGGDVEMEEEKKR